MLLDLVRGCEVVQAGDGLHVRVEDHRRLGAGFVAELLPDPADPTGSWRREPVRRVWTDHRGRRQFGFYRLGQGVFEARSIRRAGKTVVTYFEVSGGTIEVLGHDGDEDVVLARLAQLDEDALDGLRSTQTATATPQALPELTGTFRQRRWAREIRRQKLAAAQAAGDAALASDLASVTSAPWWIANRDRVVDALKTRLHAPEWDSRRAEMADAPPPGEPGPPW
jgi:hypothetical protein